MEDNVIYMTIHDPYTSPHPHMARNRLYLGHHLGRAMEVACNDAKKQLTWTWYGNIAQANEAIQYCIQKIILDD